MVVRVDLWCSAPFPTWSDKCNRSYFESFPTFILVLALLCYLLPWPQRGALHNFNNNVKNVLQHFLSLDEAEAILNPELVAAQAQGEHAAKPKPPFWRTVSLATLALGEAAAWLIVGSYNVIALSGTVDYRIITPYINATSWLFAAITPIFEPKLTVPYKLFAFYTLQLISSVFRFGSIWYDRDVLGFPLRTVDVLGDSLDLVVILTLFIIVLRIPLNTQSRNEVAEKIVCSLLFEEILQVLPRIR